MNNYIRKLNSSDVEELRTLGLQESAFAVGELEFWNTEQLVRWCESPTDICLGAFQSQRLIGFVLVGVHLPTQKATWENFFIVEEFRNTNIGKELHEALLREVRALDVKYLCFYTAHGKTSLIEYFERMGYHDNGNFVWLSRDLKSSHL